ncbi:MAG: hypothetical protein CMK09_04215 [Ponticaulis sp.]|nr:hypothetical protein [Ponticaulis sp.]
MGISIKNDEVESLIRKMAETAGVPITESIRMAVTEWLENHHLQEQVKEDVRQREIDDILEKMRSWPVRDERDHSEILYDRDGLPK